MPSGRRYVSARKKLLSHVTGQLHMKGVSSLFKCTFMATFLAFFSNLTHAQGPSRQAPSGIDLSHLLIRIGTPLVARGPGPNVADNVFAEIKLLDGRFRGFTGAATMYAIDGKTPYDMGGPAVTVLTPGPAGSISSCGQWIQHVELQGKTLIGWIHNESQCNYAIGQNHYMDTIATSIDYGLTWKVQGLSITGTPEDTPKPRQVTGESCSSTVKGQDGYYYSYCGGHGNAYVARAPVSNPGPGEWKKYYNGSYSEPGIGGKSTRMTQQVGDASFWLTTNQTVSVIWVKGGLGLEFSQDYMHFTEFPVPILKLDTGYWDRRKNPPNELLSYAGLIDATTGANQLGDHWYLTYMYLQPNEGFDKRYLVFRPVDVSLSRQSDKPQVGVMLTRWYSSQKHDHWTSVEAVPGNYSDYKLEAQLGYLMTELDPPKKTVELEECVSDLPGHPDHMLAQKGVCETTGYMRLRSAGYVYADQQPGTQPLYRCFSQDENSHFAAKSPNCANLGNNEGLLGYDLKG